MKVNHLGDICRYDGMATGSEDIQCAAVPHEDDILGFTDDDL